MYKKGEPVSYIFNSKLYYTKIVKVCNNNMIPRRYELEENHTGKKYMTEHELAPSPVAKIKERIEELKLYKDKRENSEHGWCHVYEKEEIGIRIEENERILKWLGEE